MGLLDQVIGGVLGQVLGGGRSGGSNQGGPGGGLGGGAMGGAMSPIVQALLMLLIQKGAGGLGDIFGGGGARPAPQGSADRPSSDSHGRDDGDIGGFGQDSGRDRGGDRGERDGGGAQQGRGDYSDLSGMLDGPSDQGAGGSPQSGQGQPVLHGGLDGLIDSFQRGGLGDVMQSWIGHGQNAPISPNHLADALGSGTVDTLQKQTGLGRDDLLSQLAQALPGVIDGLTPEGRRPSAEEHRGW